MEKIEDEICKTMQTTLQNMSNFDFYAFLYFIVALFIIMYVFELIIAINYDVKHNSPFLTIYTSYQIYGFLGGLNVIRKINTEQGTLYKLVEDVRQCPSINCKTCYVSKKKMCKFCNFWRKYHLKRKTLALKGLLKYFPKDIVRYKIWPLIK